MPKLYYTPTSCGFASFAAANIGGVQLACDQVDLGTHSTSAGLDFYKINPKGNVPCLVLDDGTVLNEGSAVLQWIADQTPGRIAPHNGTTARYEVQNALNYIASEVHGSFSPFFNPNLAPDVRAFAQERLNKKLDFLEKHLIGDKQFLVGQSWTIADSYLYIVLSWSAYLKFDLSTHPRVKAYYDRISALPAVQDAHTRAKTNPATTI